MSPRTRWIAAGLLCLLTAPAPGARAATGGWPPPGPPLQEPDEIRLPEEGPLQEALVRSHAGLTRFLAGHRGWRATLDPSTGGLDRAFGEGIDLGPGPGEEARGRGFLAAAGDLFAPGLEEGGSALVFDADASRALLDAPGAPRLIRFNQTHDGLPVLGSGLSLGLSGGRLVLIVTRSLGPVAVSSRPRVSSREAFEQVRLHLERWGGAPADLASRREASLAYAPRLETRGAAPILRHHLIWILEIRPDSAQPWESYIAWVDAHDGEVLAFFPEARSIGQCLYPGRGQTRGTVAGGVRPNRADDAEEIRLMPFSRVDVGGTLVDADINGRFRYSGGGVTGTMAGRFFRAHCDNCVFPTQPAAAGDASGDVDFGAGGGSSGPPVTGNGLATPADRATHFHSNLLRLLLDKWNNAFFDEIDTHVNIPASCNAFSSSYMVGFYASSASCRNTGEIRDVVYHELGHTWDRTDGNDITSGALSEYKGDLLAMALAGDSCIGESFSISGLKTTNCSGVRDIDEKAPGRVDHPLTPAVCPTCATLTRTSNNCGGGSHCLGEISGQATWHLLNNLAAGVDYITGAALPAGNPAFSAEQARWLLERLLIAGGPPMQTWDPTAAGVSLYDAMMLIDDDDANLADGTPHAAYVNAALSHHGIAESPLVIDSANCPALVDPAVTATVESHSVTGLPSVRLEWSGGSPVPVKVYRNTRAGDAFLPLAGPLGSVGSFVDVGVQAGRTYRYFVAAVNETGCAGVSPGANVVQVMVGLPDLKVASYTAAEAPGGADMDGRIEPGERVTIDVTLRETAGAASATGVFAWLASDSPDSPLDFGTFGPPVGFGTIPAGGTGPGSASFEMFVGPGEPCGGKVHLFLSMTGDQGCWLDSFDLALDGSASCAESPSAFVRVVPGSVTVASPGGDADGIADNCESATVSYQIRNEGTLPSGPATAVAVLYNAGSFTVSPDPPVCAVADLAGGASAPCQFALSLGGALPGDISLELSASSSASPVSSLLQVNLGTELDPSVFGTQSFGFEGSLQGWTALGGFGLSSARASGGAQSAHAGSTTTANICAKLISPPFVVGSTGSSTLSFRLFALIEPLTDTWYDRANLHVVDLATRQHILISPVSGVPYNAVGNPDVQICHVLDQAGWGDLIGGFSTEVFDLTPFAGRRIQIEINYDTDEGDNREGIYVDDLTITNVAPAAAPADLQPDACVVPELSPDQAVVPLDVTDLGAGGLRVSWEDLGAGYQYNLYAGSLGTWYDHGDGAVTCAGVGGGVVCDGATCGLDLAGGQVPAGSAYFLATAAAFGIEGSSGFASSGLERDPGQSTCPP